MWTRSQIKKNNINFDEAHTEWMKNKIYLGNGTYRYIPEKKEIIKKECIIHKK